MMSTEFTAATIYGKLSHHPEASSRSPQGISIPVAFRFRAKWLVGGRMRLPKAMFPKVILLK
jgi:hypothetical protein